MNLKTHYNNLYQKSISEITSGNYSIDRFIDSKNDNRFGISLIIRPSEDVKNKIQMFLNNLSKIEPNQYYYPKSDIHITIMSIISCYEGFDFNTIQPSKYVELVKKCIAFNEKPKISFNGLTVANSCILLKGFVNNNSINELRTALRTEFKTSNVEQSLDERYLIETAHATIVRLKEKLTKKDEFLKMIDHYVDYEFGTFEVDKIELVFNDWYHRSQFVKSIYEFEVL